MTMRLWILSLCVLIVFIGRTQAGAVGNSGGERLELFYYGGEWFLDEEFRIREISGTIADPLEPVNRTFFYVNEKFDSYVGAPMSRAYGRCVPEKPRGYASNFFANLSSPVRFFNCLLQAKFKGAGIEVSRFGLNTSLGILGMRDFAASRLGLEQQNEDFGLTLGAYGFGPGFYLCLPVVGPTSLRDSVGMVGDTLLDPTTYAIGSAPARTALHLLQQTVDEHDVTASARRLPAYADDSYVVVREVYSRHRTEEVESKLTGFCQWVRGVSRHEPAAVAVVKFRQSPPVVAHRLSPAISKPRVD